jgi:hypothetical protein
MNFTSKRVKGGIKGEITSRPTGPNESDQPMPKAEGGKHNQKVMTEKMDEKPLSYSHRHTTK